MKISIWERRLKKGSRFYLVFLDGGKRTRRLLEGVTTRQAAELALAQARIRQERGELGLPTDEGLSVAEALAGLVDSKRATCVREHVEVLEARVRELCAFFGADAPIKGLTVREVDRYRAARRAKDSVPTINRKVAMLVAAAKRAVKDGVLARNPLEGLQRLSDPRGPKWQYLTAEQAQALLGVLHDGANLGEVVTKDGRSWERRREPNLRLWRLVLFLISTGARKGEALRLTWGDIDLARGTVRLLATKNATGGRAARPRHVPLVGPCKEMLEGLRAERDAEGRLGEPVFTYRCNLGRDLAAACEAAKVPAIRPHDLRHTTGSLLTMQGVPLRAVQDILGHSTPVMTQRYSHLSAESLASAMESLPLGQAKVVDLGGEKTGS